MTDIGSLLIDAFTLMCTGMLVVFLFLTVLVYLVRLMSRLLPKETLQPISPPQLLSSTDLNSTNPKVIAAISAAVHQYRLSRK